VTEFVKLETPESVVVDAFDTASPRSGSDTQWRHCGSLRSNPTVAVGRLASSALRAHDGGESLVGRPAT
jgi:hypothetical protein